LCCSLEKTRGALLDTGEEKGARKTMKRTEEMVRITTILGERIVSVHPAQDLLVSCLSLKD
jgi:hypothetical protein